MKLSSAVRLLIRACANDVNALRHELGNVDAGRRAVLSRLIGERTAFIDELRRARGDIARSGGYSHPKLMTWSEWWRENVRGLKVLAGGLHTGDAVAECRHSRDRTEAVYLRESHLSWGQGMRELLGAHLKSLKGVDAELLGIQF